MRNGIGISWLGAVGAFALGWFVVRSTGPQSKPLLPQEPSIPEPATHISESALNSHATVNSRALRGADLESRVREIAMLAGRRSEESSQYVKELYEFASSIPLKEFPRVLELLQKPGSRKYEALRRELLAYWLEQNAPAARAYINGVSPKERQRLLVADGQFNPLVHAWASADPVGLVEWLKNLPTRERQAVKDSILPSVARTLAGRDPSEAFSLLLDSPDTNYGDQGQIEGAIFNEWARRDPGAAIDAALRLKAGIGRWAALSMSVRELLKADEEAVMTWVSGLTDPELAREAAIVTADHLTSQTPERALTLLIEHNVTSAPEAQNARFQSCWEWMRRDSIGALKWAQQLEPGAARDAILATMLPLLAKDQPQRAAELYKAETEQGATLGSSAQDIMQSFIKNGATESAISFLNDLPETEQMRATDTLPFYLLFNKTSPRDVLGIALQLPSGGVKDKWMEDSVKYIVRQRGTIEVQQALEQLPPGTDRDAFTGRTIVEALRLKADPDTAVALSQTLSDGHRYLKEGIAAWLGSSNPTPARQWLQQTRLFSPEEKQQLLEPPSAPNNTAPSRTDSRTHSSTGIPRP